MYQKLGEARCFIYKFGAGLGRKQVISEMQSKKFELMSENVRNWCHICLTLSFFFFVGSMGTYLSSCRTRNTQLLKILIV